MPSINLVQAQASAAVVSPSCSSGMQGAAGLRQGWTISALVVTGAKRQQRSAQTLPPTAGSQGPTPPPQVIGLIIGTSIWIVTGL